WARAAVTSSKSTPSLALKSKPTTWATTTPKPSSKTATPRSGSRFRSINVPEKPIVLCRFIVELGLPAGTDEPTHDMMLDYVDNINVPTWITMSLRKLFQLPDLKKIQVEVKQ